MQERRDMGLNDETEVSALLGLGIGTINEVFQGLGILAFSKLWLKSVRSQARYSGGKWERCSLWTWSNPGAVFFSVSRDLFNSYREMGLFRTEGLSSLSAMASGRIMCDG